LLSNALSPQTAFTHRIILSPQQKAQTTNQGRILGSQLEGVSSRMKRDIIQSKGSLNAKKIRLLYREKSINPNSPKREIDRRL